MESRSFPPCANLRDACNYTELIDGLCTHSKLCLWQVSDSASSATGAVISDKTISGRMEAANSYNSWLGMTVSQTLH